MITRDRKYLGKEGEGARELLRGVVEEFEQGLPRLERLWRYRQGRGDILMRERLGTSRTRPVTGARLSAEAVTSPRWSLLQRLLRDRG